MFDPKSLLDQFLGGQAGGGQAGGLGGLARGAQEKFKGSPLNSFGGGAAVGGVLGLLLDARGAISVTERAAYIGRVRALARLVAQAYYESREKLGFPMLKPATPARKKRA